MRPASVGNTSSMRRVTPALGNPPGSLGGAQQQLQAGGSVPIFHNVMLQRASPTLSVSPPGRLQIDELDTNGHQQQSICNSAADLSMPSQQQEQQRPVAEASSVAALPSYYRASAKCSTTTGDHLLLLENINLSSVNRSIPLLSDANLSINTNNRYGLIGSTRECGKSTLLKAIATKRELKIPQEIDITLCDQSQVDLSLVDNPILNEFGDLRTIDYVLQTEKTWAALKNKEHGLEEMVRRRENVNEAYVLLKHVYEQLCFVASGQADAKAKLILSGLGFIADRQSIPLKELSPPRRMVAYLARALFTEPALLLIDRPTNFLDVDGIVWLENYLKLWPTTLIINTQDRAFLDAVCSVIIFVSNQKLFTYQGNFTYFRRQLSGR